MHGPLDISHRQSRDDFHGLDMRFLLAHHDFTFERSPFFYTDQKQPRDLHPFYFKLKLRAYV